ncbi:ABC transporter permease [Luteolibacter marinus]|uniref:ABC transporter permease n=1 Tax=Luteolibacter marinus TaxID=2776705 RepID=UPI0018661CB1|nr:ABC transporter permease [Luteolibacter marinus]
MKKTLGILLLLILTCVVTALSSDAFLNGANVENLIRRIGLYGLLGVAVSFVIVTGGIDLSIGSIVCLTGCGLPWLVAKVGWDPALALPLLLGGAVVIGLIHGLLVTKLKLQPFVVTLCGLLVYRGMMRGLTGDQSLGFGNGFKALRFAGAGKLELAGGFGIPMPFVILMVVAVLAAVFFNKTVWGRHLRALGNNEEAARFSGVATDRLVIASYVICSLLSAVAGMLFVMDVNSAQPSDFGSFYELYAIAAAVLGGCSLRGGRAAVAGVLVGAALMQVLRNMIVLVFPRQQNLEYAVIGLVILAGVIADELINRRRERRRLRA